MATGPAGHQRVGLLLLLLCLPDWLPEITDARAFVGDNDLPPHANSQGSTQSHHVDACQPVVYGSAVHETWPSHNQGGLPLAKSSVFISDVPSSSGSSRRVYGHMTVVYDPLRTVSVLEPRRPGGCKMKYRVKVEETAKAGGCLYAYNAGFFGSKNQCMGNVVSNGRMVSDNGGIQNAHFGIRRDGTLVFGYLSQQEILDKTNPFVQLVSGAVWLLRNGEVYINQSLEAECVRITNMAVFQSFVDMLSARTAVGHDADGNLVLFNVDGHSNETGMTLWDVAHFMKKNGVINAINLDGGGSSTYVINGTLASYPYDYCESNRDWRCARGVSTILCVHQRSCLVEDCSGHGDCVNGHCLCHQGWQGDTCDALECQPPACGPHGVCTTRGCVCESGWRGEDCSQKCLPGYYGSSCNQLCICFNGASCDPVTGRCTCTSGFYGNCCQQMCPPGLYGPSCIEECQCEDHCTCDPTNGSCGTFRSKAEYCLAKQMIRKCRQLNEPYLTELTWLIITVTMASLLLLRWLRCRRVLFGYLYMQVPVSVITSNI